MRRIKLRAKPKYENSFHYTATEINEINMEIPKPTLEVTENSQRTKTRLKHLRDYYVNDEVNDILNHTKDYCYYIISIPKTYNETIQSEESAKWKLAMKEEMDILKENETFELTQLPSNKTLIPARWVYSIKTDQNPKEIYKARLVAKGCSQRPDIDYKETFSPTAKMTSIRMLMQIATQYDLMVHQLDVKSAY